MKEGTQEQTAHYFALYFTVLTAFALLPLMLIYINSAWPWVYLIVLLPGVYFISKYISQKLIENFIESRINVIYKTIHKLKSKENDTISPGKDMISEMNREVEEWAQTNKAELRQLRKEADFRKEFIGNLSHELKTPIFSIQGYLLTLLEGGLEDKQINRKYLERADKNLDRLIHLIDELEEVTELESGIQQIHKDNFNLSQLVNDVFAEVSYKAEKSGIKLKLTAQGPPVFAYGDEPKIARVLTNLIMNSIKYGKENGGTTTVNFFDLDDKVLIEIEDDGLGIAPEHLPRLFERFYRVDKSRARHIGGSGLGLAIVKHIIESHGQTVNVRSSEGQGSTFSFTLEKGNKNGNKT